MSLIKFNYSSKVLEVDTEINMILPEPLPKPEGSEERAERNVPSDGFPTLYLLHGLTEDHTAWIRKSSIERYAAARNLAVVIPDADGSFYTDMECGKDYFSFLDSELVKISRKYFPLSKERENNFVAGLSMGGYGAFKWALRKPERFAAAASLSGSLDIARIVEGVEDSKEREELEWVFGDLNELKGSMEDPLHLARELANSDKPRPKLFQCCGRDDFLYEPNVSFKRTVEELPLDLTYREEKGTGHEWDYWDRMIQQVIEWLPLDHQNL